MKRKKSVLSIIIGFIIICYVLIDGNSLNEIKAGINEIQNSASEISEIKKIEVNNNLTVYFIDVGQADSILIRENNKNILIDAGNNEDGNRLVNYFNQLGIEEFEHVFATHAHEDHIGGMDDVINNFKINNFYMPDVLTTTKTFEDVLDALLSKNMTYKTPIIDQEIIFEESLIKILSISNVDGDLNDTSIVFKLTHGNNSFLFTGDATENIEKSVMNKDIKSDVLKVAHHGSHYSNSLEFLEKVNPKYAIISVGANNSYKHPHDVVLKRLKNLNVHIYRTDEVGTIIVSSDGSNISITKE